MNPFQNANAHECAHHPAPTTEDNLRLTTALNKIFNKDTNEMTEQTTQAQEETVTTEMLEAAGETSAVVATALLEQDGWAILTDMQKALLTGINQTSLVVLPVLGNQEEVYGKVSDPEGLKKIMATLSKDILTMRDAITVLSSKHEGKTGEVGIEDMALVDTVSTGYSTLMGHLERGIQPLVLQVADILEAAGITSLEIK